MKYLVFMFFAAILLANLGSLKNSGTSAPDLHTLIDKTSTQSSELKEKEKIFPDLSQQETVAYEYIINLKNENYEKAYNLLDEKSKERISLEKYSNGIWAELGIERLQFLIEKSKGNYHEDFYFHPFEGLFGEKIDLSKNAISKILSMVTIKNLSTIKTEEGTSLILISIDKIFYDKYLIDELHSNNNELYDENKKGKTINSIFKKHNKTQEGELLLLVKEEEGTYKITLPISLESFPETRNIDVQIEAWKSGKIDKIVNQITHEAKFFSFLKHHMFWIGTNGNQEHDLLDVHVTKQTVVNGKSIKPVSFNIKKRKDHRGITERYFEFTYRYDGVEYIAYGRGGNKTRNGIVSNYFLNVQYYGIPLNFSVKNEDIFFFKYGLDLGQDTNGENIQRGGRFLFSASELEKAIKANP